MSKRLQRCACVLLAVMMVGACVPGLGVAEDVTTPSDLPQVTEVPTEVPTEIPTEVPTEEPTEVPTEEPPVLVVEEEELPMLMATNQNDLSAYGLRTSNGTYRFDEFDNLILESGSFETTGGNGLQVSDNDVTVNANASLRMSGSGHTYFSIQVYGSLIVEQNSTLNNSVYIYGYLTDYGSSSYRSLFLKDGSTTTLRSKVTNKLTMQSCTLTMESGSDVYHFEAKDSTVKMNGGKISSYASLTNCTLNGSGATFDGSLALTNTKGELKNGSIQTLAVAPPSSDTFTTNGTEITNLNVTSDSWLKAAIENYTKDAFKLYQGGTAPTNVRYPQSVDYVTLAHDKLQLNSFNQGKKIYFVLNRKGAEIIADDATTYTYKVTYHFGNVVRDIDVNFPVIERTKIHLAGGTVTKTYDGNGNFSGTVENPVWQTENGDPYLDALACTVSGSTSSADCGSYTDVACTVSIEGHDWPSDVSLATTEGKVGVEVVPRPLTIVMQDRNIAFGDDLWRMQSEPTFDGLLPNHHVGGWSVQMYDEYGDKLGFMDMERVPYNPGTYTIEVTGRDVLDENNTIVTSKYKLMTSSYKLTVAEPTDTYTVTIPATASVNQGELFVTYKIGGPFNLELTVASRNGWKLIDGDKQPIPYTLKDGGGITGDQGYTLGYTQKQYQLLLNPNPTLDFSPVAGTYIDTLTFTVTKE